MLKLSITKTKRCRSYSKNSKWYWRWILLLRLAPLFNKSIISARPVLCWYIFDARGKSLLAITLEMKPQQQQVHQFLGQEEPALIFAKYLIALILSTYLCIIIEDLLFYLLFMQVFYPLFRRYLCWRQFLSILFQPTHYSE